MPKFNKVAIIGTGLIGGSIAADLKKNKLAKIIVGVSLHRASLNLALKKNLIDKGSRSLGIIAGADMLIIATPVDVIIKLKNRISGLIDKNCIVIDVGSTKKIIVAALEKTFPCYVGVHPLAGSEKRGVIHAHSGLFRKSLCIITPTKKTPKDILSKVKALWLNLGAKVLLLSPDAHDKALSFTSHLPHAIAFSLIASIPRNSLRFASGGLKDTTRIAASSPVLWRDIFLTNRSNLLAAISLFELKLSKIKKALRKNDAKALELILKDSRKKRELLG